MDSHNVSLFEYLENLSPDATSVNMEEILFRIRTAPQSEIDGYEDIPLFILSEHFRKNKLFSKEDMERYLLLLKEFSKRNADFKAEILEGITLLMDAVQYFGEHNFPVVEYLVHCGVDINAKELGEISALDMAISLDRHDIAFFLIESGCECEDDLRSQYIVMKEPF